MARTNTAPASDNEQATSQTDGQTDGAEQESADVPGEGTFKLNKTKEIPERFRGDHVIRYSVPVAVKGDLEATIANLRPFFAADADFSEALVGAVRGQGLDLLRQKRAKDFLADCKPEVSVEEGLAGAAEAANAAVFAAPRQKSDRSGKVAKAEARTAAVANTALEMYKQLPAESRAQYREALLATGGVTAEQLDAVDNA